MYSLDYSSEKVLSDDSKMNFQKKICDFCGSNTGPPDLQSDALPTELKPLTMRNL